MVNTAFFYHFYCIEFECIKSRVAALFDHKIYRNIFKSLLRQAQTLLLKNHKVFKACIRYNFEQPCLYIRPINLTFKRPQFFSYFDIRFKNSRITFLTPIKKDEVTSILFSNGHIFKQIKPLLYPIIICSKITNAHDLQNNNALTSFRLKSILTSKNAKTMAKSLLMILFLCMQFYCDT